MQGPKTHRTYENVKKIPVISNRRLNPLVITDRPEFRQENSKKDLDRRFEGET